VVGVDIKPQPHYPFEFHQADALEYLAKHGHEFDVIHASPPCQTYSVLAHFANEKLDLIPPVRQLLQQIGRPFVIENVPGAPLQGTLMLCGTMFGLGVIRHRIFECWPAIFFPPRPCAHQGNATGCRMRKRGITRTPRLSDGFNYVSVAGNNYLADEGRQAMGIDWMPKKSLSQAIPPAYTQFIGSFMRELIL